MKLDKLQTLLVRYVPNASDIIEKLEVLNSRDKQQPNVVVYGSYNSGKSSLLNSITDNVDSEYFPTHDVPETRITKSFEQNNVCFIDTPGLDVNDEDTQEANTEVIRGDIVLLVHKLTAGSIQRQDLNAIKKIFDSHGEPKTVLFVLTGSEIASSSQAVIEEITNQIQQELSGSIKPLLVSNSMYKKGVLESKAKLVEFSGIPVLREKLAQVIVDTRGSYVELRQQKYRYLLSACLSEVQQKKASKQFELEEAQKQDVSLKQHFVDAVKNLQSSVDKKLKEIESI